MTFDLANADVDRIALAPHEAKALASEIITLASNEEEFDAAAILKSRPELAQHRSVVVDLAYEEFCRRLDAGAPPNPREFAQRFPAVAESLLELLEVHEYLDDHPDEFVNEPSPTWPEPGDEVSKFSIVREIGRGGFSRVFLARDTVLGNREVVVKICSQANEEAARLGQLDHPHIVPVFSVHPHPHPGFSIICMPYLGSATLGDVLDEGLAARRVSRRPATDRSRLTQVLRKFFAAGSAPARGADVLAAIKRANEPHGLPREGRLCDPRQVHWTLRRGSYAEAIVESGAEICEALAYAHREGICHCDVKPSNVLLTANGQSLLLDFNLSMQRGVVDAAVGGTLPYMAPEQLRLVLTADVKVVSEIDHRTDLFSLGVTMFQLLTGRLPFQTDEPAGAAKEAAGKLLEQQRSGKDLGGELEQVVSPAIARMIAQCLAFDPNDRPESAEQVARRLRDELRIVPRIGRWLRAHKLLLGRLVMGGAPALALAVITYLVMLPPIHVRECRAGLEHLEAAARCVEGDKSKRSKLLRDACEDFLASYNHAISAEAAAGLAYCITPTEGWEDARLYYLQQQRGAPKKHQPQRSAAEGAWEEACSRYAEAVELGFATPALLNNLGYCLAGNGDFQNAVDVLHKAVALLGETKGQDARAQAAHHNLANAKLHLALNEMNKANRLRMAGGANVAADLETPADHETRATDSVRSAMEDIDAARKYGPPSAQLEFVAACIYASVSKTAAAAQERSLWDNAITSCQTAVALGLFPLKLNEVLIFNQELEEDPRLKLLLEKKPASSATPRATLLLDVCPDIRDGLAFSRR